MKIKICGLTRYEDIDCVNRLRRISAVLYSCREAGDFWKGNGPGN